MKLNRVNVVCDYCGEQIEKRPCEVRNHNFCNFTCYGNYQSKHRTGANHPTYYLEPKLCKWCKKSFKPKEQRNKFCSTICSNAWRARNQKELICTYCGNKFKVRLSLAKKDAANRFCSRKCQNYLLSKSYHHCWITDRSKLKNRNKSIRMSNQMKEWRKLVYERDNYTCSLCKSRGGNLNAHHIKKFSTHHELRFEVSNGITLCNNCHKKIQGKENIFEPIFYNILDGE